VGRPNVMGTGRPVVRSARRHSQLTVLVLGVVWLVAGCVASGDEQALDGSASGDEQALDGSAASVSPEAFEPLLDAAGVTVVNVHVPYEGELPTTDLFVPYDEIAEAAELPDDRDAVLAVYCLTGRMSREAAGTLRELGYERVVELNGGMVAWRESGRQLLDLPPEGSAG